MRIGTNILSLAAQRSLAATSRALSRALERLSSGKRINRAQDDPAGLAISTGLESQIRGLTQTVRNLNDASSILQVAEGALSTQLELVQRMRELALQSANGTLGSEDRNYLNRELQSLFEEFNRITSTTSFNGTKLLDGSFQYQTIQVGTNKGETIDIRLNSTLSDQVFTRTLGTGTFSQSLANLSASAPIFGTPVVDTGDINGDGILDLVVNDYNAGAISVRIGLGDGTFTNRQTLSGYSTAAFGPTLEDFDNDGKLDLIASDRNSNLLRVYIGNGMGQFTLKQTVTTGSYPGRPVFEDFNNDGIKDFAVSNTNGTSYGVYLGNGSGGFSQSATLAVPSTASRITSNSVGDIDKDGDLDILAMNFGATSNTLYLNNGDGTFTAGATFNGPSSDGFLLDLNRDGNLDMIGSNQVLLGDGQGNFSSRPNLAVSAAKVVDMNEDGILDVIGAGSGVFYLQLGNGNGTFKAAMTMSIHANASNPNIVDLNGDGHLDVAISTSVGGVLHILMGSGSGTFTRLPDVATSASAGSPLWYENHAADLNGDGFVDMINPNYTAGTLSILIQQTADYSAIGNIDISTQEKAQNLLQILDDGRSRILRNISDIGALQSRLSSAEAVTSLTRENISQARSLILDADIAEETSELMKQQVLQQAGISVLAQANVTLKMVLELLKNRVT